MLTIEWRRRIDNWRRELPHHVYRPLGAVEFRGYVTAEQLTAEVAAQRPLGGDAGAAFEQPALELAAGFGHAGGGVGFLEAAVHYE